MCFKITFKFFVSQITLEPCMTLSFFCSKSIEANWCVPIPPPGISPALSAQHSLWEGRWTWCRFPLKVAHQRWAQSVTFLFLKWMCTHLPTFNVHELRAAWLLSCPQTRRQSLFAPGLLVLPKRSCHVSLMTGVHVFQDGFWVWIHASIGPKIKQRTRESDGPKSRGGLMTGLGRPPFPSFAKDSQLSISVFHKCPRV